MTYHGAAQMCAGVYVCAHASKHQEELSTGRGNTTCWVLSLVVLFLIFQNVEDCFSNKGYFEKENKTGGQEQAHWEARAPSPAGEDGAVRHSCPRRAKLPPVGGVFLSRTGMRFCQVLLGEGGLLR